MDEYIDQCHDDYDDDDCWIPLSSSIVTSKSIQESEERLRLRKRIKRIKKTDWTSNDYWSSKILANKLRLTWLAFGLFFPGLCMRLHDFLRIE